VYTFCLSAEQNLEFLCWLCAVNWADTAYQKQNKASVRLKNIFQQIISSRLIKRADKCY